MSVWAASSHNTAEPKYDMLVGSMTCIAHNSLVFYSCKTSNHKNQALMPLLGNVVISKNFLRTCKIMVMHSNEMGECCLRTLVVRSRKRYINAVDVVVRLHVRPIQVPKARHLRVLHTFGSVTSSPSQSSKRG